MAEERLDIVIFGATGFTGKCAVREAQRLAKVKNFTWGIAGRRKEALESVLKEFAPGSENISIIIADLKDEESLRKMTKQAKVIVNCCGPYRLYGEPVVKACIATRTHHVDISGEPQFMERMQLEYNKAAQEAGIYIISACGYDSIAADLGIIYTQNKFGGEINSVEIYVNVCFTTNVRDNTMLHFGTWESAVYGMAYLHELNDLRSKLYPQKLPKLNPTLKQRFLIHPTAIPEGWSTIFPGPDRSVCLRTQRYFYEKYKQRPVQIQCYITFKSLLHVFVVALFSAFFFILVKSAYGRTLLLKYPKFFSYGLVSHEGPKPDVKANTHISMTLIAKGWTEKMTAPIDHKDPPNKQMITRISLVDPGYGSTTRIQLISAITILHESDKIPENGGVLPPGAAFAKTSMIDELIKHGIKFEVIS